jgi:hypothetical protein
MFDLKKIIKNIFVKSVRYFEYSISGQSEYKLIKEDFEVGETQLIKDNFTAGKLLKEIKGILSHNYSMQIEHPVVLEVVSDSGKVPFKWKEDGIGKYHSQMMIDEKYHMIYVMTGLVKYKFCAIIAHELMHAFLYEKKLFIQNQFFREAMARWIEYRILIFYGMKEQALKLLEIREPEKGGKLNKLLELEEKVGGKGLIPFLIEKKREYYSEL